MAIAYDNSVDGSFTSSTTQTTALIVGSGANRILIVGAEVNGGDLISGITYAGVSMTQLVKIADATGGWSYLYYLLSPSSGNNNIVLTSTNGGAGMNTAGVAYSGVPNAPTVTNSAASTSSPIDASLTPVTANSWIVAFGAIHNNPGTGVADGAIINTYSSAGTFAFLGDTGAVTAAAHTVGFSNSGGLASGAALVAAVLDPSAGGGGRGLFMTPPLSGVGVGGSFFRDPLQAREVAQFKKNRSSIYVPERMAA